MGYRAKVFKPRKVTLSADYWAMLRPLTSAENMAVRAQQVTDTDTLELTPAQNLAIADAFLLVSIVEWNVDDDDGMILPISAESLGQFGEADRVTLLRMARELITPAADKKAP